VEVAWLDRPLSAEQVQRQTNILEQLGPTGFVLKILPRSMAEHLQKGGDASLSQILGLAIAHELGHLLLRSNAHWLTGIMQAQWRAKDLQRASKGLLLFTPEQTQIIRAEVLRRVKRHESLYSAGPVSPSR